MFTSVRVVVEPGMRTAVVSWEDPAAWEDPAKRSLALYLLLSDDRSIAGGVAAAGIAAADCRNLVLLWASQQQKEVVVHQSGRKPSERVVRVAKMCGLVGMCGSWASPRNPEGQKRKTDLQYNEKIR